MRYAEVSVNSPVAQRRTFSYSVPDGLEPAVGQAVWVPFGEKTLQGIVMELTPQPGVAETRDIADIVRPELVLPDYHLKLARWICDHYLSPLFDSLALLLPPAFERKAVTFLNATGREVALDALDATQQQALEMAADGPVPLKKLEQALGKRKAAGAVTRLVRQGFLSRSYDNQPARIRPRRELRLKLVPGGGLPDPGTRQRSLYDFLASQTGAVAWPEARQKTGCDKSVAAALHRKGLVAFTEVEVSREPIDYNNIENIEPAAPLALTPAQRAAYEAITTSLSSGRAETFLLHGVTGSGKTEVYLQALAEAVRQGRRGIVLVPEIALTPQAIERFAARFPRRVAVLHSQLTLGERFDEWRRIRDGEFDVVIGSRSALFAPQPNLGLIVVDEEHEWSYKQDTVPDYHAREAAVKLAELTSATVVLGSATPDVESYYKAENGVYRLLELPERVTPGGAAMPEVTVVDMRRELKAGNRGIFSRALSAAINEALTAGEQVILFLNRRGGATFVQCRQCGLVLHCRRCQVPLAHHVAGDVLTCHQCNYKTPVPPVCPECGGKQLKFLGGGTQKLEQEVGYTFPRARQLRWDSDAIDGRTSNEDILRKFRGRQAEILIGTQMVAKGLDIPSVTLVGVVSADTSLNLPDFRAGERTFQLLSQVAGRAGRGAAGGRVIIQTFSPDNYAVKAAAAYDYAAFYKQEIAYRRRLHNPPFARLARLVYAHTSESQCRRETTRLRAALLAEIDARGLSGLSIIGPAPAYIQRQRGRYRWQLVVRGANPAALLAPVPLPHGWSVDVDPVNLL